jgi:diaminopimelate decarboxylase
MYGSYHEIENLSRAVGKKESITIAGNVCESGDLFAIDRLMAIPKQGDILVIRDAGAYGMSMASTYNLRALPQEILLDSGRIQNISQKYS